MVPGKVESPAGRCYDDGVDDVKITAEPALNGASCRFIVDRELYEGAAFVPSKERAAQVPLAARIFDLPSVKAVLVSGNSVTVTAGPHEDWRPIARQIAVAIREQITSGKPSVDPAFAEA